jgi:FHS family L-fucose permease-like MFS transporter
LSFPPAATEHDENGPPVRNQLRTLLAQPRVRFGVTALFFYVAAQFGVWTFTTRFVRAAMPELSAMAAADVLLLSWVLYMAGRFAGTVLMYRVKPTLLLAICAGASLFLTACAAGTGGLYGVACLAGTSFFMSIMFPTIFGNTIRDLGPLTKSASALLVTATGGGVTAAAIVMNLAVEFMTVQQIMLVPSLCFAAVLAYTLADRRANKASTSAASDGVSAQ